MEIRQKYGSASSMHVSINNRYYFRTLSACLAVVGLVAIPIATARAQNAPYTDLPCMLSPSAPGVFVLFSGRAADAQTNFVYPKGKPVTWKIMNGSVMLPLNEGRLVRTRAEFRDLQLHIEFKVPPQGMGGVLLKGCYSVAIRDSYGKPAPETTDCGAIFQTQAPLVNASTPANQWQSFDILFNAPRFGLGGRNKLSNARMTVYLNGTLIQDNTEVPGSTLPPGVGLYDDASPQGPIAFGGGRTAVEFRNIWVLPLAAGNQQNPKMPAIDQNLPDRDPGQNGTLTAPPRPAAGVADPNQGEEAYQDQGVYYWGDLPQGEPVPAQQALFDRDGYRIIATRGQTIVVPFANQNLNVMKFGRSNTGQSYFVNEGAYPVLYLTGDAYLESSATQDTRWYPLTRNVVYKQPVYVGLAPNWNAYTAMGWYPGMSVYGGYWGYPGSPFGWMPGYGVFIDGVYYRTWGAYYGYYMRNQGFVTSRVVKYGPRSTRPWSSRAPGTSRPAVKMVPVVPHAPGVPATGRAVPIPGNTGLRGRGAVGRARGGNVPLAGSGSALGQTQRPGQARGITGRAALQRSSALNRPANRAVGALGAVRSAGNTKLLPKSTGSLLKKSTLHK